LIWATANNFRHYDEWAEPSKTAMVSIRILDAAEFITFETRTFLLVLQVLQMDTYETRSQGQGIGQEMLSRALGRQDH
jgi:hypothetical protein